MRIYLDNTTAECYLSKHEGTRGCYLSKLGQEIALHLPGSFNSLADQESRRDSFSHDWKLNPDRFNMRIPGKFI